ncbi:MAG: hypothetical protein WC655_05750 [Candidatus Hydrogenedentales bacterium]
MTLPLAFTIGATFYMAWVAILRFFASRPRATRGNPFLKFKPWQARQIVRRA